MLVGLMIIAGFVLLFFGGELLVRGAIGVARGAGLSPFVIGLTVVAYGTSSPELIISLQSALQGQPDIALGNVIGSNISNILCVLGLTALIYPVAIDQSLRLVDSVFIGLITLLLFLFVFMGELTWVNGVIFIIFLLFYTYMTLTTAKKDRDKIPAQQTDEMEQQIPIQLSTWQSVILCMLGAALLMGGAYYFIEGATQLALQVGISEAAIGVTLVAFGGSLPELTTSVVAACHKRSDIVFGNILGSNLFNLLGIIGITTLVKPIPIASVFVSMHMPILCIVTLALCIMMITQSHINRWVGGLFFVSYLGYIALAL